MTSSNPVEAWRRDFTSGPLTAEEFTQFFEDGYVIKHDLLPLQLLDTVLDSVSGLVDDLVNRLYETGNISNKYSEYTVHERLIQVEKEFPNVSVLLHKQGILPKAIADLWSSPELLAIARQLLGGEISGHPVWNLRVKTPQEEQSTVPWHQDSAYLESDSWHVLQATAWIPLVDVSRMNGCMQMASRGHRSGKVAKHSCCVGNTWYVGLDEQEMAQSLDVDLQSDIITCEMPRGSVLLFNNLIPHRSLDNLSDKIRWSLDLRWQRPDEPNGFYGLKDNILMVTSKSPDHVIEWDEWAKHSRTEMQDRAVTDVIDRDEFDSTVAGPWMSQWPIVNHNRHTEALKSGVIHHA
jgi:ectoine hydroxylase-related dioxygenase (phytanoyl-CoA dioxygenase family)